MLIKKGAEASLYLEDWHGRKVIMKRRLSKKYRIYQLDSEIRYQRTVHESQIIHKAKQVGVPTPSIFMIDTTEATIVMEFIDGKQVKQLLNGLSSEKRRGLCPLCSDELVRVCFCGDRFVMNLHISGKERFFWDDAVDELGRKNWKVDTTRVW